MLPMRLEKGVEGVGIPHYLYDTTLPIKERAEKKLYFPSGMAAANFIGVPLNKL